MSGLSNADFAKIYATGGGEGGSRGGASAGPNKRRPDDGGKGNQMKKFKPANFKKEKELQAEKDLYRDRAKERRLGISSEYGITEEAVKGLTVEESKYLGGDMEHTHLVKGLDFALLAKVRSEMTPEESVNVPYNNSIIFQTYNLSSRDHISDEKKQQQNENHEKSKGLEVRTPLGGFLREHLISQTVSTTSNAVIEFFLQGRTTFQFDLEDDFGDIPTTISKSLEDLPAAAREKKTSVINKNIMSSISTIMSYIRQGSKPNTKKLKKKVMTDNKPAPAPAHPTNTIPDEDIFDDAGTYDLNMRASEATGDAATNHATEPIPPPPPPPPANHHIPPPPPVPMHVNGDYYQQGYAPPPPPPAGYMTQHGIPPPPPQPATWG